MQLIFRASLGTGTFFQSDSLLHLTNSCVGSTAPLVSTRITPLWSMFVKKLRQIKGLPEHFLTTVWSISGSTDLNRVYSCHLLTRRSVHSAPIASVLIVSSGSTIPTILLISSIYESWYFYAHCKIKACRFFSSTSGKST